MLQLKVLQAKTLLQLEDRGTTCYNKGDFRQVGITNTGLQ